MCFFSLSSTYLYLALSPARWRKWIYTNTTNHHTYFNHQDQYSPHFDLLICFHWPRLPSSIAFFHGRASPFHSHSLPIVVIADLPPPIPKDERSSTLPSYNNLALISPFTLASLLLRSVSPSYSKSSNSFSCSRIQAASPPSRRIGHVQRAHLESASRVACRLEPLEHSHSCSKQHCRPRALFRYSSRAAVLKPDLQTN